MAQKRYKCASIFCLLISLTFKVLIVLQRAPLSAPFEAVLDEQTVAQVALRYFVRPPLFAVGIAARRGRLYDGAAVLTLLDAGVVQRVDVDGQAQRVLRQFLRTGNGPEVEAAGVVVRHRAFVVSVVVVDQPHPLYWVLILEQNLKDFFQVVGYHFVTYQLAIVYLAVAAIVRQPQIAQFCTRHAAVAAIRFTLHPLEHLVADGVDAEGLSADAAEAGSQPAEYH